MNIVNASSILVKANNCFYVLLDDQLKIQAANEKFVSLLGEPVERNAFFLSLFPPSVQEQWQSFFNKLHEAAGEIHTTVIAFETKKQFVQIEWNACFTRDAKNENTCIELLGVKYSGAGEATALTGSSKITDAYLSLFEYTPNAVLIFDQHNTIVRGNQAAAKLIGYPVGDLKTVPISSLFNSSDLELVEANFQNTYKGLPVNYKTILIAKTGEKIDVEIIHIPIYCHGTVVGTNAIIRNITKSLAAERLLLKQEAQLRSVLAKLRKTLNSSLDIICSTDSEGKFIKVSPACINILGYQPREMVGKNYIDFVYVEDLERSIAENTNIKQGFNTTNFENRYYRKDGSIVNLSWSSRWDETDKRFYNVARDATEKKQSEEALRLSEEKYKILFYNHPLPTWIYDIETLEFLEVNEAAIETYGYSREDFMAMTVVEVLAKEDQNKFKEIADSKGLLQRKQKGLWIHKKKNNDTMYAEVSSNFIDYHGKKARLVLSVDRTEQTIAQRELMKSNEKYTYLSEATFDAIWDWDILNGNVQWNDGVKKMFEMPDLSTFTKVDWWFDNLHEDDRKRVETKLWDNLQNHDTAWEEEYRFKIANGQFKYVYARGYIIYDAQNVPVRMIGAMQDLTDRKSHENTLQKLNSSLERRAKELAESNAELERFAYVASHDLQEPLRMVTSFLQLLEKRYKDKLDQKAHEYIAYAVDGSERMKRLILDLLEYSRVNSSKLEKENVEVNEIIQDLKLTYKNILLETHGQINSTNMPEVKGNKTQLMQLFQNLVGNAFKYKSNIDPVINISCEEDNLNYTFAISDNGIGIDPKFFDKIFIIFQRLHNRDQYTGTGIGLAICKKIIDKHGGRIWVTSVPNEGSTFYFTLPKFK